MNMIESVNWPRPRMLKLESLYRDGLSFSLIAADIGVTRSAAIGKAHRMQLPKRIEIVQSLPGRQRAANPAPRRRRSNIVRPAPTRDGKEPVIIPGHDYRCTINDLVDRSCRYPLWPSNAQHHERFYCGVPDASFSVGVPYCRGHAKLCESRQY